MTPDKLLGALGLARRAGKLTAGFDAVCQAAQSGEAALVLLAQDASDGTQKRVRRACEGHCPVRGVPLGQNDIACITRKPVGVLCITDRDLATLCQKALDERSGG